MATMYPDAISPDTESGAEKRLYELLQAQLDSTFTVIHSVGWQPVQVASDSTGGEHDFVIAHPDHGILVVEVKGGQIHVDRGTWYSVDRFGVQYRIKNPFRQANANVHALLEYLDNHRRTKAHSYPVHYAVAFPDGYLAKDEELGPDAPRTVIIDQTQLDDIAGAITAIYKHWHARYPNKRSPGTRGIEALVDALVPKREIRSRISHLFETEAEQIKRLTENQYSLLRSLQLRRRAVIVGSAGTGKTMLALEKARQLADAGHKVLLLCYNSNLSNWLQTAVGQESLITVSTYHHICFTLGKPAAPSANYSQNLYENAPDILHEALGRIHASPIETDRKLFDAVIVDEGQDFDDLAWITIPELLKDEERGILYVFFDDNQNIYSQLKASFLPDSDAPYVLTDNCRNTEHIFKSLEPYSHKNFPTRCIGPVGQPREKLPIAPATPAHKQLQRRITALVHEEGVSPSHIIILTPRRQDNSQWKDGLRLGQFTLSWRLDVTGPNTIRVSTIHSFKGLESPVVILTEMEEAFLEKREQLAYVGISRARNLLIVLGNLPNEDTA